ncbi:MAG: hypothetical protein ABII02_03740 [Candidatus Magasanikbacteria bacterium]
MLNKPYTAKLRKHMLGFATKRRDVIKMSGDALHHAKRAIFAMHKDDLKEAEAKLKQSEALFSGLHKKFSKDSEITNEGSYKAGLEEYVEASLFYQFLTTGRMGELRGLDIVPHVYIAGICDVPGELLRYATKAATNKDEKTVKKCAEMAKEIVGELIEFNLTSYLRTKFDQAKRAVQKIEYIQYELSLRK